jgi:hypothetical protein
MVMAMAMEDMEDGMDELWGWISFGVLIWWIAALFGDEWLSF